MKTRLPKSRLTALAFVGVLGLTLPGFAQPQAGNPAPAPKRAAVGNAVVKPNGTAAAPSGESWVERVLARLHRQLRITTAQEAAWSAYAITMRAVPEHLDRLYQQRAANYAGMSAVENLRDYQKIQQAQAEDLARQVTAFAALYNGLSAEQKQTADRIFRYREERRQQRRLARLRRFQRGSAGAAPRNGEAPR